MECGHEGCVDLRKVCDGTDDCGDKTDEQNCGEQSGGRVAAEWRQSAPLCLHGVETVCKVWKVQSVMFGDFEKMTATSSG